MKYSNGKYTGVKIAYIGGGSRGWAWGLMSDLAVAKDIEGTVSLYDIDMEASKANQIIGEKYKSVEGTNSFWDYEVASSLEEALTGANFVVISILPGTFNEMASDVHTPEKYGIYQSVGDTVGAGGIVRTLRTAPMFEEIGLAVKKCCPDAWVINYTNPMTLCVKTLYRVFPKIKAFGCCHEVFATQNLLKTALKEIKGVDVEDRQDIKVNVIGVNHFTWLTSAQYKNVDIFEVYKEFVKKYKDTGFENSNDDNWANKYFYTTQMVKFDLFHRYGYIAAAGDRHLAEFCPGSWYLNSPKTVDDYKFALTGIDYRWRNLEERLQKSKDLVEGKEELKLMVTGEDGVDQIRALLGLHDMITNVNIPNMGQIPNLPLGAVVETNAIFRSDSVQPVLAGPIPKELYSLISRICGEQEALDEAIAERDLDKVFNVFANDPQIKLTLPDARKLFDEMVENTKEYLKDYFN